ncbi:MAG: hypothetical protein EZS28_000311 [Streblomastix strix]|uniref:Uncharacterized protein n=1 Tax=Streblomastix strix TaxID=222440 RepID=A0A5J4XAJ7_9EUKA|nr:MAG: hypothetical protein EZS28_000311 [Streblomastix strix]
MEKDDQQAETEVDGIDAFSKFEKNLFMLGYPLFDQVKHPSLSYQSVLWAIQFMQLLTISFFRIDLGTQQQSGPSYIINFFEGTSESFILGRNITYLILAMLIIEFGIIVKNPDRVEPMMRFLQKSEM